VTRPALAAFVAAMLPCVMAAQDREKCKFDPATPNTNLERRLQPSGQYNTYIGRGGVIVRCPTRNITLRADSLESYGDESRLFLLGHVHYVEPRLDLTSDFLTYHQQFERIVATSNVVAILPNGSTLRGPTVDYFRVMPGVRDVTRLLAPQRPTITVVQKDSTGKSDTLTVLANTVNMVGDSLVYASGAVVMTRPEVEGKGDSLFLDSENELMVLMRDPSITGRKDRPFTLSGVRLELTSANHKLQRVLAMGQGKAVSEDMTLASDTIDLRVSNDLLDRAIAWGPGRAKANSATQQIVADSIDVRMPGQRVRELHAVRAAAAEAQPDTSRFKADTVDWLRGDTIVARFDSAATRDTTRVAQIKELVANGKARSWYHLPPSDTSLRQSAINYVTGRQITVAFQQRKASNVTVIEKAAGVYAEPKPPANPKAEATNTKATKATTAKPAPPKPPR